MSNERKIIWRGTPHHRSLRAKVGGATWVSYLPGDEIQAGTLGAEREARLLATGEIECVDLSQPPTRSIVETGPEREVASAAATPRIPSIPPPREPQPHSIAVPVGCVEVTIEAGPDETLGTDDDLIDIKSLPRNPKADETPDTAPTRKRKSKSRGKKKNR